MENLFVAISNLPAVLPIATSYLRKDHVTTCCITFVAIASAISHLVENHKHGMPGIGFSKNASYILNRIDVAACVVALSRMSYIYYVKNGFSFGKFSSINHSY